MYLLFTFFVTLNKERGYGIDSPYKLLMPWNQIFFFSDWGQFHDQLLGIYMTQFLLCGPGMSLWLLLDLWRNSSPIDSMKGIIREERRTLPQILTMVFGSSCPSPMWLIPTASEFKLKQN